MRWKLDKIFVQPNGEIELPMDSVPVGIKFFNNLSDEKAVYYLTRVRPQIVDNNYKQGPEMPDANISKETVSSAKSSEVDAGGSLDNSACNGNKEIIGEKVKR